MCALSSADRVPGYEPVGQRFESSRARQKKHLKLLLGVLFLVVLHREKLSKMRSILLVLRQDERAVKTGHSAKPGSESSRARPYRKRPLCTVHT